MPYRSPNGFSPEPAPSLTKSSFTDAPPGMFEFYQTLVERGFAPPLADGDKPR